MANFISFILCSISKFFLYNGYFYLLKTKDDLDIDTKYHQALNKAIYMDKERNKENDQDHDGSQYLTLRQFGWNSPSKHQSNKVHNSQTDLNRSSFAASPTTAIQMPKKSSIKKNSSYDEYESLIIKNIQSIRRNSKGGGLSSASNSSHNSNNDLLANHSNVLNASTTSSKATHLKGKFFGIFRV
jgi:hypothetical protein